MATIKEFKAITYNKEKINNFAQVVAPPYDIIDKERQTQLYQSSPYNVVRLILNKSQQPYKNSASLLDKWLKRGILKQDSKEAIYLYQQEFKLDNKILNRIGFFALKKINLRKDDVLPHEDTFPAPKKDRLKLLKEVKANLSPVFGLFSDPRDKFLKEILPIAKKENIAQFYFDGVRHSLFSVRDEKFIHELKKFMKKKDILIADGHHRYQVAVKYCWQRRRRLKGEDYPFDWVLMFFAPLEHEVHNILPTHRLLRGNFDPQNFITILEKYFKIKRVSDKNQLLKNLKNLRHCIGIYGGKGKFFLIRFKKNDNEIAFLHEVILKRFLKATKYEISYAHEDHQVIKLIDEGKYKLGFFLKSPTPFHIRKVAQQGEVMPHKSTYFYPKILTGLVI